MTSGSDLLRTVRALLASNSEHTVPALRKTRREVSRRLRDEDPALVLGLVLKLVAVAGVPRWFSYELLHGHRGAMATLALRHIERLGAGLSTWGDVDAFACCVSGPAWREGRMTTRDVRRWAASRDRWRRRAALVSTVPLNNTARGGRGDPDRTLAICDRLKRDRDDMVVKAMSWALRELAKKKPRRVGAYLADNRGLLAPRVVREVRNKLATGVKNPPASAGPENVEGRGRNSSRGG